MMKGIYHRHKILRRTIAGSWCVVTGLLVSPGTVKGMFSHRHQFHMRKAHLFYIRRQHTCYFAVRVEQLMIIGIRPPPGAKMHFIYRERALQAVVLLALLHPFLLFSLIVQLPGNGSRFRPLFPIKGKGVSLE